MMARVRMVVEVGRVAKLEIYLKVEPKDFLVEFGRIASRMAPGIFVLVFGLWVEREESGRTGFPSGCTGGWDCHSLE